MGRVTVQQDNYSRWFFTRIADDGSEQGTSSAFATREEARAAAVEKYPDDHLMVDGDNGELPPPMPKIDHLTEADTMGLTH